MAKNPRPASCDICQRRQIDKPASKFCPHCEDGLCSDCLEYHGASRATSLHHIIPIDEYKQLPSYVSSVKHRCEIHKAEFEFYCSSHAVPCCVDCTKDGHKTCLDLQPLHEVVKNVKHSNELNDIEKHLAGIVENIVKLTKEREDNLASLETQKTKHTEKIKRIKEAVIAQLDKIESKILGELNSSHDSTKEQIEALIKKLNVRKKKANAIQEEITLMKQAASNLQNFIGMRDLEKRVNGEGETLKVLQEDENFYHSDIRINYSEILTTFSEKVPVLGDLAIETSPKNLSLTTGRRRSSQIVVPKMQGIEHIKPRLVKTIKLRDPKGFDLSGCKILDSGKLLFLDWKHERLLTCENDATETKLVADLKGNGPFDLTCISDDKIAISSRTSKSVVFVEYTTGNILKKVNVNGECFGIDQKDGKMLVRLVHSGIFLLMDMNGKIVSRVRFPADRLRYLALYMDRIYCTITGRNTVLCMNMKGSPMWEFQNVLLREPFGITVDTNGFVYVAGRASNNVVLIAPDGKSSRILLSDREGIAKPQAVYVSKFRRQLLVCNKSGGSAFLFDF